MKNVAHLTIISGQRNVLPSRKTNFSLIAYQDKLRGFLQKVVKSKNSKIAIVILSLRICGLSVFKVTRFKKKSVKSSDMEACKLDHSMKTS